MATREGKEKGKTHVADTWFRKVGENSNGFDLQREKETFLEEKMIFMGIGDSTSKTQVKLVPKKNASKVVTAAKNPDSTVLKSFL